MEVKSERYTTLEILSEKEVINVADGKRLGYPCDIRFDLCDGKVTALIAEAADGLFGRSRKGRTVIPWDRIEKIGRDTILVSCETFAEAKESGEEKKRKFFL